MSRFRGGLSGHDPAVAVGDHHGLAAGSQHIPDRGDILGQPGALLTHRLPRLAAAGEKRRLASDPLVGQEVAGSVPPPRSVPDACPVYEHNPHHDHLVLAILFATIVVVIAIT